MLQHCPSPFVFHPSQPSKNTYLAESIVPQHKSINISSQTLFTKHLLHTQIDRLNEKAGDIIMIPSITDTTHPSFKEGIEFVDNRMHKVGAVRHRPSR